MNPIRKTASLRAFVYACVLVTVVLIDKVQFSSPWLGYTLVPGYFSYTPDALLSFGFWSTVTMYISGPLLSFLVCGFIGLALKRFVPLFKDRIAHSSVVVLSLACFGAIAIAASCILLFIPELIVAFASPVAVAVSGLLGLTLNILF